VTDTLLIFHIRPARLKARTAAMHEAAALLRPFAPKPQPGGPLSDQKGVFWLAIPSAHVEAAAIRLPRLGYAYAVDVLETAASRTADTVKWRGGHYTITRLYEEDAEALRERAPDRRAFALQTGDGEIRTIKGYRGDGGQLSKRGLPVHDSRLLVNLVTPESGDSPRLLDPFGGVGGIVLEAVDGGYQVYSGDLDPALRFGLSQMGARHSVLNAAALPFPDATFDAIATEPPYDPDALGTVIRALQEMARVLKPGGRLALLCAEAQAAGLRTAGEQLGLTALLDLPIDRKGLPCALLVWQKLARI
jgi:SAM-dependent methyltransferase